jgi:hypothetical protein
MQEEANCRLDKLFGVPRETQAPARFASRFHPASRTLASVCSVCRFFDGAKPVFTSPEWLRVPDLGPHWFGGFSLRGSSLVRNVLPAHRPILLRAAMSAVRKTLNQSRRQTLQCSKFTPPRSISYLDFCLSDSEWLPKSSSPTMHSIDNRIFTEWRRI